MTVENSVVILVMPNRKANNIKQLVLLQDLFTAVEY